MNQALLVGRLTKDIQLRKTQSGKSVVSFTVAINRKFSKDEQTDFINCVAWEKTAEFMANYLHKGRLVSVEGFTQSRSFDDKDGKRVYVQEIVANNVQALDYAQEKNHEQKQPTYEPEEVKQTNLGISPDDLPF